MLLKLIAIAIFTLAYGIGAALGSQVDKFYQEVNVDERFQFADRLTTIVLSTATQDSSYT
eukprot:g1165.t1